MLIGYFKAEPTEHVLVFRDGAVQREGAGIAFWYWKPSTSIVLVPTATADIPFVFNEVSGNFQPVTVQGQLTYRIIDPARTARILNFTIDPRTRDYRSEDPDKLSQRIVNVVQGLARNELTRRPLEEVLRGAEAIAQTVLAAVRTDAALASLGIEVNSLYITSIRPTPETAKALEADFRELLLRKADEAIYARRAAAVEQERKIKENELSTAVTLAEQRKQLVELEGQNAQRQAEFAAEAVRLQLVPYKDLGQSHLMALAFHRMGEQAAKIGQLNITPELVAALMQK